MIDEYEEYLEALDKSKRFRQVARERAIKHLKADGKLPDDFGISFNMEIRPSAGDLVSVHVANFKTDQEITHQIPFEVITGKK